MLEQRLHILCLALLYKFALMYMCMVLGAHTLGRARTQNTGYNFPWIAGGENDLDNRFYIDMRNRDWVQVGQPHYYEIVQF